MARFNKAYSVPINSSTYDEIFKSYDVKIKIRSNGSIKIKQYDSVISKLKNGFEDPSKDDLPILHNTDVQEKHDNDTFKVIRRDSLTRTRNLLIDYACQNEKYWRSFITLTFADNVTDINEANIKFHKCMVNLSKKMKRQGLDLMYLGTPEFQKRGAVHYHLLTNLECGSVWLPVQAGEKNMFDLKDWQYGFTSGFALSITDNKFNIALYITKYLYKDIDNRLFGRNKILKSNNLEKPLEFELMSDSDTYCDAISFINEKGYNVGNTVSVAPTPEYPFAIPCDVYNFNDISQEDINTLLKKIKDKTKD